MTIYGTIKTLNPTKNPNAIKLLNSVNPITKPTPEIETIFLYSLFVSKLSLSMNFPMCVAN